LGAAVVLPAVLGALAAPAHASTTESIVQFGPGVTEAAGRAAVQVAASRATCTSSTPSAPRSTARPRSV
jgi:hypothetical protein